MRADRNPNTSTHRDFFQRTIRTLADRFVVRALAILLLAGASALPAAAQSLSSVLSSSPYSPSERQAIESTIRRAGEEGVPRDMLLPRLEQGIARGAPSALVIEVLQKNARELLNARAILQSAAGGGPLLADPSSWSLTATLLAAGVNASGIDRLASASGGKPAVYRSAALLYGSLAGWGLDSQDSLAVCLAAIRSSLPASQYSAISDIFVRSRAMRIPPGRMVARLLHALPHVTNYEDLEREVLY